MTIYYLLLLLYIYLYVMKLLKLPISRNLFIFIAATSIFFIIAFRDFSVGVDTWTYIQLYNISGDYVESYKTKLPQITSEFLFYVTANLIKISGASVRLYIVLTSFFIVFSISIFIKRYSKSPFISYWLFITLGFLGISMSGLRQMLALSIVLLAFIYLYKGKKLKYIVGISIAGFFHFSAFIMLPLYLFRKVKLSLTNRNLLLIFTVIVAFVLKDLAILVLQGINITRYSEYFSRIGTNGTNPLVVLVSIGIPLVCSIFYEKSNVESKNNQSESNLFDLFYLMSCINVAILIISTNIDIISRFSYYFSAFNLLLIPNAVMSIKYQSLKITVILSALTLSFAQFVMSTPGSYLRIDQYLFFWQ